MSNETMRRHKLLTKELRKQIPPLGSTDRDEDTMAVAKYFTPLGNFTWFVIEGSAMMSDGSQLPLSEADGTEEDTFLYNYCESGLDPSYDELGMVSLNELEELVTRGIPGVERDLYFTPTRLGDIRARRGSH